jgi:hypothetical protein
MSRAIATLSQWLPALYTVFMPVIRTLLALSATAYMLAATWPQIAAWRRVLVDPTCIILIARRILMTDRPGNGTGRRSLCRVRPIGAGPAEQICG